MRVTMVLFLLLLIGACAEIDPQSDSAAADWAIIRSPITGKCYEIAVFQLSGKGVAGMSETNCVIPATK